MDKVLKLQVFEQTDSYGDVYAQEVVGDEDSIYFTVHDLSECSEDAIIRRGLFSARQYIDTLGLGMELAQKGYTSIEYETIEENK